MSPEEERNALLQIIREKQKLPLREQEKYIKYAFYDIFKYSAESTEKQRLIKQLEAEGLIKIEFPSFEVNPLEPSLDLSQLSRSDLRLILHAHILQTHHE